MHFYHYTSEGNLPTDSLQAEINLPQEVSLKKGVSLLSIISRFLRWQCLFLLKKKKAISRRLSLKGLLRFKVSEWQFVWKAVRLICLKVRVFIRTSAVTHTYENKAYKPAGPWMSFRLNCFLIKTAADVSNMCLREICPLYGSDTFGGATWGIRCGFGPS